MVLQKDLNDRHKSIHKLLRMQYCLSDGRLTPAKVPLQTANLSLFYPCPKSHAALYMVVVEHRCAEKKVLDAEVQ